MLLLPHEMVKIVLSRQKRDPPKPKPFKFTSFESASFKLVASVQHSAWHIRRKCDNATTYAEFGYEGFGRYKMLKRAWAHNRRKFDTMCAAYQYYDEAGKPLNAEPIEHEHTYVPEPIEQPHPQASAYDEYFTRCEVANRKPPTWEQWLEKN